MNADVGSGDEPKTERVTTRSLDALAGRWQAALDLEADALESASRRCRSLGFLEQELAEHKRRLTLERENTARLLTMIADQDHLSLHCSLSAPRATRPMLEPSDVLLCVSGLDGSALVIEKEVVR